MLLISISAKSIGLPFNHEVAGSTNKLRSFPVTSKNLDFVNNKNLLSITLELSIQLFLAIVPN